MEKALVDLDRHSWDERCGWSLVTVDMLTSPPPAAHRLPTA